jgi:hypothetical protein
MYERASEGLPAAVNVATDMHKDVVDAVETAKAGFNHVTEGWAKLNEGDYGGAIDSVYKLFNAGTQAYEKYDKKSKEYVERAENIKNAFYKKRMEPPVVPEIKREKVMDPPPPPKTTGKRTVDEAYSKPAPPEKPEFTGGNNVLEGYDDIPEADYTYDGVDLRDPMAIRKKKAQIRITQGDGKAAKWMLKAKAQVHPDKHSSNLNYTKLFQHVDLADIDTSYNDRFKPEPANRVPKRKFKMAP